MKIVIPFLLIFVSYVSLGQISADKVDGMFINWASGEIEFETGELINCHIRYDQLNQNMDVRYQGVDLDIPYKDIKSFNFYDSTKRSQRRFEKVVVQSGKVVLMEYIFSTERMALMEERFIRKFHMAYPDPVTFEKREFRITSPVSKKFLYNLQTKEALVMSYTNLLEFARDKENEIRAFVKRNRMGMEKEDDFIRALEHYEELL